jgi:hypothetical protein
MASTWLAISLSMAHLRISMSQAAVSRANASTLRRMGASLLVLRMTLSSSVLIKQRMAKCSAPSANHLSTYRRHVQALRSGAKPKVTFSMTLSPLLMNYS